MYDKHSPKELISPFMLICLVSNHFNLKWHMIYGKGFTIGLVTNLMSLMILVHNFAGGCYRMILVHNLVGGCH